MAMPAASATTTEPDVAKRWASPARVLLVLLVAGLVVRGALWPWFHGLALHNDEIDYDELATSLVERGEFATASGQITSIRPPLYPFLIAGIYELFGVKSWQAVRAAQALLSLGTMGLVYLLGRRLYNRRIGLIAAGLACFYPSLLAYNNLLLTEVLFTFWLTAFALVVVSYFAPAGGAASAAVGALYPWRNLAIAGVLLALAASTRSVMWLFPPLAAGYLLLAPSHNLAARLLGAASLVAAFVVVILPWTIRNTWLEKTLITIDCMGGRNLMMGNYEYTPLQRAWDAIGETGERAWYRVLRNRYPEFPTLTQGQRDKLAMREGLRFMLAHPALTLKRDAIKFFNFWQLEREVVAASAAGQLGPIGRPVVALIAVAVFGSYAAVSLLAIFGAVMAPPPCRAAHWFLLMLIAFVCGMHTLVFAHSRYHLPLIPLLFVYAASAAAQSGRIWARRATWQFWLACAIALALIGGWVFEIITIDIAKFMDVFA